MYPASGKVTDNFSASLNINKNNKVIMDYTIYEFSLFIALPLILFFGYSSSY